MLLSWVAAGFLLAAPDITEAPLCYSATPLSEPGRYRCGKGFDETLDYYESLFQKTGGVRWRSVVNLPGIRAKHVESQRPKTHWDGINIYEYKGETRIFVLPRPAPPPEPPKKAASKSK